MRPYLQPLYYVAIIWLSRRDYGGGPFASMLLDSSAKIAICSFVIEKMVRKMNAL